MCCTMRLRFIIALSSRLRRFAGNSLAVSSLEYALVVCVIATAVGVALLQFEDIAKHVLKAVEAGLAPK